MPSAVHSAALEDLVQSITGKGTNRNGSLLLKLPLEIRQHIYRFLLPCTTVLRSQAGVAHVWLPGVTGFLATCQQVHHEATELLYGDTVFVVEVGYDTISFRHRRLLESGLLPQSTKPFLETMRPHLYAIRNIAVSVEHVDSYTGER